MEVNSRLKTVVTQLNGQAEGLTRVLRDHDEGLRTLAESHLLHLEQSKESTEEVQENLREFHTFVVKEVSSLFSKTQNLRGSSI